MCSTNTAVALNKYVIAKEKELRKLFKVGGNGNFGLKELILDIKNFFSIVKTLATSYTGITQPSLLVPVYKMVFERRNRDIFHRPRDRKILE